MEKARTSNQRVSKTSNTKTKSNSENRGTILGWMEKFRIQGNHGRASDGKKHRKISAHRENTIRLYGFGKRTGPLGGQLNGWRHFGWNVAAQVPIQRSNRGTANMETNCDSRRFYVLLQVHAIKDSILVFGTVLTALQGMHADQG
jgi:hypothetical protein